MQPDTQRIAAAIDALEPYMVRTLSDFVAAQSPSGAEQPAARYIEQAWRELGLAPERILLDDAALKALPLYACPCGPDDGRYNLLARHVPAAPGGRSVLFNGHIDVVPTGPAAMVAPALRAGGGGRLAVRPWQRRHEGRHRLRHGRLQGAARQACGRPARSASTRCLTRKTPAPARWPRSTP